MEIEKQSSKGQAWFCTTGLPSDIVIEVGDIIFHLHKFPLISKSRKLHQLISEQETISATLLEEENEDDDDDQRHCRITLPDFPGGSDAFEGAAKFCYGVKIDLSSSNVAFLRCAAEFLEMTDEYSEDNLISKTERFLSQSVLKSVKDSINTLKSCEGLIPMAEDLDIVHRCIEFISVRASVSDPSLFGWPVNETGGRRKPTGKSVETGTWLDELVLLSLPFFKRLILAMRGRDLNPEIIENSLLYYAKRYIPGINRNSRKSSSSSSSISSSSIPSECEQRDILETIVSNLPLENSSKSPTVTRFLFGLLRMANILKSDTCQSALEKKIGSQLEQATLDDLLIPSYSYLNETLYDIECMERILGNFLDGLDKRSAARIEGEDENSGVRSAALMLVGKLIDGYLSEIASDSNLKPEKFYELAVALPDHSRLFDDGLYRSVDVYLKAHPWLTEAEREKICGLMDCQKLTLEACTHAAQNERLPIRSVVQVLFFEQLQLREVIAGTLTAPAEVDDDNGSEAVIMRPRRRTAVRENHNHQVLRLDMDSMRSRVHELERECSSMKAAIESIDKVPVVAGGSDSPGPGGEGWKSSLGKKFGCKFKTQVCDSHQPTTVVETRKVRNRSHRRR
ncbi:BTB/POZ domain-containing protein At5g66560-like [Impatiens glandulifera]|uniref:BTB/POZ domain-containing protein At5g66560-like n=1 Tax=Impatiens glandulifera TaxID=253017 RepID=UPI001FB19CA3|nr:BTB/POZ domain-containing protein At5g66560-like [Impatiens glandulifera]